MANTATRHIGTTTTRSGSLSRWRKLTLGALLTDAVLLLLLVMVILPFISKGPVEPAAIGALVGNVVLAGLVLRVRRSWPPLAASAFLLLGILGALPHDLPAVIQPDDAGHFVFAVLNFAVAGLVLQ